MTLLTLSNPIRTSLCLRCHNKSLLRQFHASTSLQAEETFPNHYSTLDLPPTATAKEIKSQFYALSKKHHPDLNPSLESSQKFVQISEAYHILGSPLKRSSYDRDYVRIHQSPAQSRGGSYSSHGNRDRSTSSVGGRPASGLSRRRTQFRGPPPSFYKAGGYGETGSKRQDPSHSSHPQHRSSQSQSPPSGSQESTHSASVEQDPEPDIPHWDRASHTRTHETLEQRQLRRMGRTSHYESFSRSPPLIFQFLAVTGIVALAAGIPAFFSARSEGRKKAERKKGGEG